MIILGIFTIILTIALPTIKLSPLILTRICSIIILYAGALSFNVFDTYSIGSAVGIFNGFYEVSSLTLSFDIFILFIGSLIVLPWFKFKNIDEFSLVVLLSITGSLLLISASDLLSLFLSLELQSFGVYVLSALYRDSESATSSGLKYFLLGGLSSALILLGSIIIYSFTGLTNFDGIIALSISYSIDNINIGLVFGLLIILIGLFFKVSAAPFHNWSPDVYDGVPTIITTWLTIIPKISIIVFLTVFIHPLLNLSLVSTIIIISALLSLVLGSVVGLAQYRIKRLLAYSTISHIGFILLAFGTNASDSLLSILFYLVQYTITNLNTFFILIAFSYIIKLYKRDDVQIIDTLKGQFIINPILSLCIVISLFSIAGIPPLIGFFAKLNVLHIAIHSGYYFIAFIGILTSIISAFYYIRIIKTLIFVKPDNIQINYQPTITLSNVHSYTIAILTLILILYWLNPTVTTNLLNLIVFNVFNY